MKRFVIVILFIIFLPVHDCFARSREFRPWNSRINVGDEVYVEHRSCSAISKKNVTAGFQGGAYFLVKMFQVFISPQDGPNCRHKPTCSVYGRDAIVKYGALIGSFMAGERLLRCNPFHAPEVDPVPDRLFGE